MTTNTRKFDVIIVGAGPVGLVAANLLGLNHVNTLVIEREDQPYTYPRAIGIDDEALRILQSIGFTQDEFTKICKRSKIEYFSKSGYRYFESDVNFRPFGYPIVSGFLQPKLELFLREQLKQYSCVEFLKSTEFLTYSEQDNAILVEAKNVKKTLSFHTKFLFGCDGGKSVVRKCMGLDFAETHKKESWLVVDLIDSDEIKENINFCKTHTEFIRPVVTIDLPDNLRRFEVRITDEHFEKGDVAESMVFEMLFQFLKQVNVQIIRGRVYDRYFFISTAFNKNNVFLLGDAAHLLPPYGGQGMCSGIRDAANLCWKVMIELHDLSSSRILDTYEIERRFHLMKTIEFIKRLSFNVEDKQEQGKVYEHITTEQYRKLKPSPYFEEGFLVPSPYAGQLMLQPYVSNLNNDNALLDDFLGNTFAIIGINNNPTKAMSASTLSFWNSLNCRFIRLYDNKSKMNDHDLQGHDNVLVLESETQFYNKGDVEILFVRPDRFILATTTLNNVNKMTSEIIKLFNP